MRRLLLVMTLALLAAQAHAQRITDPKTVKTGRTEEGLKNDAEFDKEYRAKAGQQTPNVKADPWGDVRTFSTNGNAAGSTSKSKRH